MTDIRVRVEYALTTGQAAELLCSAYVLGTEPRPEEPPVPSGLSAGKVQRLIRSELHAGGGRPDGAWRQGMNVTGVREWRRWAERQVRRAWPGKG